MMNEYLAVYLDNLSWWYVISIVISALAVFLTWKISIREESEIEGKEKDSEENGVETSEENESLLIQLKMARQNAIMQKIVANMTPEQLDKEREVETQQLSEILKLLKEQEDKFNVKSMEELESQLKLYKR